MSGLSDEKDVKETQTEQARLGDLNDIIKPIEIVEQEIQEKKQSAPKKRKRGRPSKKEKEAEVNAERQQLESIMKIAGTNALKTVVTLIDSIVSNRVEKWEKLNQQETQSLAEAINSVVVKYLPSIEKFSEEFSLVLVLMSIIGARAPKLFSQEKKIKND